MVIVAHRLSVRAQSIRAGGFLTILGEYERDPSCDEAVGALNRWPDRFGLPSRITSANGKASAPRVGRNSRSSGVKS
jgi:hypothetical protein